MEFKKEELVKSPLNYVGGKFKILPQILTLFPSEINTFIDLFGGGCNVGINVKADNIIYNELMPQVVNILKTFKNNTYENIYNIMFEYINTYKLSKENQEGYLNFRDFYNSDKDNYIALYTLICYGFSNQIRFNKSGGYNMPFGKDRSSFNPTLQNKLKIFIEQLHKTNLEFLNEDFGQVNFENLTNKSLVYCDPPYLNTTATYNENGGWTEKEEQKLYDILDDLNKRNIKFALSNVLEDKGRENLMLKEWSKKYNVNYLNNTYSNCNYQAKNKDKKTVEVLITNYII